MGGRVPRLLKMSLLKVIYPAYSAFLQYMERAESFHISSNGLVCTRIRWSTDIERDHTLEIRWTRKQPKGVRWRIGFGETFCKYRENNECRLLEP